MSESDTDERPARHSVKQVLVPAGGFQQRRVRVLAGDKVGWSIREQDGHTIEFAVSFAAVGAAPGDEAAVVPKVRRDGHVGSYVAPERGEVVLSFSNEFSYFTDKSVITDLHRFRPSARLHAAATPTRGPALSSDHGISPEASLPPTPELQSRLAALASRDVALQQALSQPSPSGLSEAEGSPTDIQLKLAAIAERSPGGRLDQMLWQEDPLYEDGGSASLTAESSSEQTGQQREAPGEQTVRARAAANVMNEWSTIADNANISMPGEPLIDGTTSEAVQAAETKHLENKATIRDSDHQAYRRESEATKSELRAEMDDEAVAELESVRQAHRLESEAAESTLRSEMDELRGSHAAALEAASKAAAAAQAEAAEHMAKLDSVRQAQKQRAKVRKAEMDELRASHAAALGAESKATAAAQAEAAEEREAALLALREQMLAEHQDRQSSLETELASFKSEQSSAASSEAEAVAELESVRQAHRLESEAAESTLRSEMDELRSAELRQRVRYNQSETASQAQLDELRASHAAALGAESKATAAAQAEAAEEREAALLALREQMLAEHQDRQSSLETELASFKSEQSSAVSSEAEAVAELESVRQAHRLESEAAESTLRSEMDELRGSHAAALEAASKAAAAAQAEAVQEAELWVAKSRAGTNCKVPKHSRPKYNSCKYKPITHSTSLRPTAAGAAEGNIGSPEGSGTDSSDSKAAIEDTESMEEPEPPQWRVEVPNSSDGKTGSLGIERLARQKRKRFVASGWTWPRVAAWVLIVAVSVGCMVVDQHRWQQMLAELRLDSTQQQAQPESQEAAPLTVGPSVHAGSPKHVTHSECECLPVTHHYRDDGLLHSWVGCGEQGWWCDSARLPPRDCQFSSSATQCVAACWPCSRF
eukprot:COSAG02_NODE_1946_length_10302_cov_13.656768_2_plen_887_part_00